MREVDRLAVEVYGLQIEQMMENAGRHLAELTRRLAGGSVHDTRIAVAIGKGNNGGGGMVAARHLHNWGADVTTLLPEVGLSGVPAAQLRILRAFRIKAETGADAVRRLADWTRPLVLDALIGYGLTGNPRGWSAAMIDAVNANAATVIALDVPSGLDATSGVVHAPCIKATATMTLALPKTGLLMTAARDVVGAMYLADIGIPATLYTTIGLEVPHLFSRDPIVRLISNE
jgi:NAD(P)H-hydrate epimerase